MMDVLDRKPAARDEDNEDVAVFSKEDSLIIGILQLPPEIISLVYSFMDIPMLGSMAQIHQGPLKGFANAEDMWIHLVHERFQITSTSKKPKSFGGKDWKDAYRSMHLANRMPKSRFTNRKAIFAKGSSSNSTSSSASSLSVWVTLHHTENCRTRILRTTEDRRRYVDLWVCLQNTHSNGHPIRVDIAKTELHFLGGLGQLYVENCIQEELSCGYRWLVPRVLYKHHHYSHRAIAAHQHGKNNNGSNNNNNNNNNNGPMMFQNNTNGTSSGTGIILNPMEFCIVSIPFACGQDVFETDVLARTVSLHVPFSPHVDIRNLKSVARLEEKKKGASMRQEAQAWFMSESDIWDQYSQLPGGCLTLSNVERRMHL